MKRCIYLIFICLYTNCVYSQNQNFAKNDVHLYLNKIVKVTDKRGNNKFRDLYQNFYLYFDSTTNILTNELIGKKKANFKPFQITVQLSEIMNKCTSDPLKLEGMEFKVVAYFKKFYKSNHRKDYDNGNYLLVLQNDIIGFVYYEYNPKDEDNLEFDVLGGLDYPEGYWCNKITVTNDKFDDLITSSTPNNKRLKLFKIIDKGITNYFLNITQFQHVANVNINGVYILFDDGTKWIKKDNPISVEVIGSSFHYSSLIRLTTNDLEDLKNKKITDTRLYIFDDKIESDLGYLIQEYAKCIQNK